MLKASWNNGISIKTDNIELILDPIKESELPSFVSHAHRDHICGLRSDYCIKISTIPTISIGELILKKKIKNAIPCNYGEPIDFHELELQLINSGHVFGSASLILKDRDVTLLYTGDLNFTDSLIQKAISPHECDILIIETTYGRPGIVFPPREQIYLDIIQWAAKTITEKHLPILLVYPLGKAQEITKLFNLYTSIPVVSHPSISRINFIFREFGNDLIYYDILNYGDEIIKSGDCVCLFPSNYNISLLKSKYPNSKIAIVTGWAAVYKFINFDACFPLSSHADYPQLIDFTLSCRPKKVFTIHGYAREFASRLTKMGIEAHPI
ncbi:MAG: MBL fold metallo-hydrolase [Candidatus Methanomethyliaceae archaeon]|nr:MBL fold metallo-hydrolase [Candidatus Methanomethyliaceae archaeon]MDW7971470.1 MBL fold metallo-hydrolase [Nitrososphaerota archaeon]